VEDDLTVANLRTLGIDAYQGYIAGRPAPWK
jgi:EAL domain-containing protein (putative c-di-GMP-specific phosphodiesterase class I)